MARELIFDPLARLQSKDGICRYLGGISSATYDAWHAKGIVPGPVPGTTRYDLRQHDHVLDQCAGLSQTAAAAQLSPLEQFEAAYARTA